jgi:HPt (histidine-containing phosphotransfer) domain-containing protein
MEPIARPALDDALRKLWDKFLPQMEERVALLEEAGAALDAGLLTSAQRNAANAAAHKLAGVLGSFGLTRGTILAREAEILYSGEPQTDPDAADQLRTLAVQLRAMIEARKASC